MFKNVVTAVAYASLLATPAGAEQFSVKCMHYFLYCLSFDTEAKKAVYELDDGPITPGTIESASNEEISFYISPAPSLHRHIVWMPRAKKMVWRAIPSGEYKTAERSDACERTELRPSLFASK